MKKILLFISALAMLASVSMASAANLKVGVLDVQKVMQQIPQVTAVQKKLKKQFATQEKQITTAQKQLRADLTKFNKNRSVMKDSDKKALQKKIMSEQDALRGLQINFQQQVMAAQKKAMQSILNDVETAVNSIAKAKDLDLVLTKASIAYNDDSMDITDQVVKKLKK